MSTQKRFQSTLTDFSTKTSRKFLENYKKATGKVLNEKQLLKNQEVSLRQQLANLYELIHSGANPAETYVEALKIALRIHDQQPILPTTISYLALYLSIHEPNLMEQYFQDMDPVASFLELALLENPMKSCLYFMRCLVLEDVLEIRKQLESGLKLEHTEASWIWPAWRFGTLLSSQAEDWNAVVSWSTKAIQVLKKTQKQQEPSLTGAEADNGSTLSDGARSLNSASSTAAAVNVENSFSAAHVIETLFEQPPQPGNTNHQLAELFFYRASALRELGLEEEARDNFEIVLELDPSFATPYNEAALEAENNNEWQSALDNYNILLKLEPTRFSYLCRAASTSVHFLDDLENVDQSIEDEDLMRVANQAISLYSDALESLQQNPVDSEEVELSEDQVYVQRGMVYERIDENQKAMTDYTTAIQLNQKNRDALRHRAALFEKRDEIKEAVKDYESLVSQFDEEKDLCKENAPVFHFLAQQKYIQGNRRESAKLYTDMFRCGLQGLSTDVPQTYEIAVACGEDFLARTKMESSADENSDDAAPKSASLTQLCLSKLDEPYAQYFGPFSNPLHEFRKMMSDRYFLEWHEAAEAAKDPKAKKGKKGKK